MEPKRKTGGRAAHRFPDFLLGIKPLLDSSLPSVRRQVPSSPRGLFGIPTRQAILHDRPFPFGGLISVSFTVQGHPRISRPRSIDRFCFRVLCTPVLLMRQDTFPTAHQLSVSTRNARVFICCRWKAFANPANHAKFQARTSLPSRSRLARSISAVPSPEPKSKPISVSQLPAGTSKARPLSCQASL